LSYSSQGQQRHEALIQGSSPLIYPDDTCAGDELLRLFFDGTFETDAEIIERYFMDFAFLARAGR
jgi:hypothetical protein